MNGSAPAPALPTGARRVGLLLLCACLSQPLLSQEAAAPVPPALTAPAAAASWPHSIVRDGATVTIYQPQAISWPDRSRITARAALAITRPGQAQLMGTIELALATRVDEAAG